MHYGSIFQAWFSHDGGGVAYVVSNKVKLSSNIIPASTIVDSIKDSVTDTREYRAIITVHRTWSKDHMPAGNDNQS